MKKAIGMTAVVFSLLFLASCGKDKKDKVVEGYKPIYATAEDMNSLEVRNSEALNKPGRIFIYDNYLFVNDEAKGIHIYDNSNQAAPKEVSFIAIPGNMDFSVNEGMIYADNITDMLVIDISNPANPQFKNRMRNVFPVQQFPAEFGAFECVDPDKGVVVGWEKTTLTNPKCFK
jgi:predicted dinucleotide-binding enzyme